MLASGGVNADPTSIELSRMGRSTAAGLGSMESNKDSGSLAASERISPSMVPSPPRATGANPNSEASDVPEPFDRNSESIDGVPVESELVFPPLVGEPPIKSASGSAAFRLELDGM